jgi:hypothetical protein
LFALDENRLALTALGAAGQTLWTKHFSSLISAVDANSEHTVVGTLDGKVQVFDLKGNSTGPFVPGGSRVPVIFNVAISRDGQRLLVLAGIDPKRFLLLEKGGGDFRPVFHKSLTENKPWPTWLGFLDEGQLSFHEVEEAVIINQISNGAQESLLPFRRSKSISGGFPSTFGALKKRALLPNPRIVRHWWISPVVRIVAL